MLIRPLTPDDADAYGALRREMLENAPWAFASSIDEDAGIDQTKMAIRLAEPGQAIVGAFDNSGRLVGAAGLVRNSRKKMAHRATVWGVYVTPSARGLGLATEIFNRIFEVARSWPGVTSLALSVSERAEPASRIYQRLGFKAWGVEPAALEVDGRIYSETHMVVFLDDDSPGS